MNDAFYMHKALALARKGQGYTAPNPMVGAVVVQKGQIVGSGYHRQIGGPHAEVHALAAAGRKARGGTLYVTLEPCNHTGRTPPCTEKILQAGIQRVVVAMPDPNPYVAGGGAAHLSAQGLEVVGGVCQRAALRLNESYLKYIASGSPLVILKAAMTLDGSIATRSGDAKWVSGEASRRFVHRLRHAVDAIMVGIGTVKADDPRLTTRLARGRGCDPVRVILDTHLAISEQAKVLRVTSESATLIVCGNQIDPHKRQRLEAMGAEVLTVPCRQHHLDLKALMVRLGRREITSILIEGGARVNASALAAGIVDKLLYFYAPKLLGGNDGVPVCRGQGVATMRESIPVQNLRVRRFGADVLLEGYINDPVAAFERLRDG